MCWSGVQVQAAQQQQQAAVAAHQVAASQVAAHMQAAAAADAALVAPSAFDGQQQQQGLGFDGPQQVLGFDARGGLQGMYGGQSLPPPPASGGTSFDRGGSAALSAQALARQGSGLGQGPSLSSQGSGLGQTMGLASQGSGFDTMNGSFDGVYAARQRAIKFGVPPILKSAEPADFVPVRLPTHQQPTWLHVFEIQSMHERPPDIGSTPLLTRLIALCYYHRHSSLSIGVAWNALRFSFYCVTL